MSIHYERLKYGTSEELQDQINKWINTTTPIIFIKNIPDEMDEKTLREVFDEYGCVHTVEFVQKNDICKIAIIQFTSIHRDEFITAYPEPYTIRWKEFVLNCYINNHANENSVSQLTDMFKTLEQRYNESTREFIDEIKNLRHELSRATNDFAHSKAIMMKQIANLTEKITDITTAIEECGEEDYTDRK